MSRSLSALLPSQFYKGPRRPTSRQSMRSLRAGCQANPPSRPIPKLNQRNNPTGESRNRLLPRPPILRSTTIASILSSNRFGSTWPADRHRRFSPFTGDMPMNVVQRLLDLIGLNQNEVPRLQHPQSGFDGSKFTTRLKNLSHACRLS